jgi:hypothetical protein
MCVVNYAHIVWWSYTDFSYIKCEKNEVSHRRKGMTIIAIIYVVLCDRYYTSHLQTLSHLIPTKLLRSRMNGLTFYFWC